MILLFLLLVLLTLLVLHLIQEERMWNEIRNIPGPPIVPFFRSESEIDLHLQGEVLKNVEKLTKEYGSVVRLRIGSKILILLTEPEYVEQLLKSDGIQPKEDFYESILNLGEKKGKYIPGLKAMFLYDVQIQLLERLSDCAPVDSQLFSYFVQKDFPKTILNGDVHLEKSDLALCLFKAGKNLKDVDEKLWPIITRRIPGLIKSTNPIIRYLVVSALIILAKQPGLQRQALDEIKQIFGTKTDDVQINFQKVKTMKCLEDILKIFIPPHAFYVKTLTKKIRFGNILVPAGVNIVIFPSGESPRHPNPSKFDSNVKLHVSSIASYKRCVGQEQVVLMVKLVLTKVLRNFEILPIQEENESSFKLKPR